MFGALYVGLAGMNAYSKGLDLISNNVANLNTTGFKAGIASFGNVVYRNGGGATQGSSGTSITGAGVHVDADQQNFRQGDLRSTNNPLDAALEGSGFFILERDGQRLLHARRSIRIRQGWNPHRTHQRRAGDDEQRYAVARQPADRSVPRVPAACHDGGESCGKSGAHRTARSSISPRSSSTTAAVATQTLRVRFTRSDTDPLVVDRRGDELHRSGQHCARRPERFASMPMARPAADNAPINVTVTPDGLPAFTFALNFGARRHVTRASRACSATRTPRCSCCARMDWRSAR